MRISKLLCLKLKNNLSFKEIFTYQKIPFWWDFRSFCFETLQKKNFKLSKIEILKILFGRFYLIINSLFVLIFSILFNLNDSTKNYKKIFVVSPHLVWRPPLDPRVKRLNVDHNFYEITSLTQNGVNFVGLNDNLWFLSKDFKIFKEKRQDEKCIWKPLELFLTPSILLTAWRYSKKLEKEWHHLREGDVFRRFFNRLNIDSWQLLKIDFFFRYILFHQILYLELMKQAIDLEKPDLILISLEYSGLGRAAVLAGKIKKVPTLAIQHGIIHPFHVGYFHLEGEVSNEFSFDHTVIPDKTAVCGMFTKDVLTNFCGYPNDAVVVTGQPRYDLLTQAEKVFSRKQTLERHGLSTKKQTILLISQRFSMSHSFIRASIRALKKFSYIQIIIKPHPLDKNYEWHDEILRKENYPALVLDPKSNTFEALFACDVMLTVSSTVAIETMFLNKPVVIVNLTGEPDPMPYVESGAALGVYDEKDLAPMIKKALFDERTRKELEKKRKEFIKYHLYDVGNATRNIIRLVEKMITG